MSCNFNIIAECSRGYIGQCTCCNEYNFAFNNLLITFSEEHLAWFFDWLLQNRDNPDLYFPLANGQDRIYRSPLDNFFITFNFNELEELEMLYGQVQLVWQARKIVNTKV